MCVTCARVCMCVLQRPRFQLLKITKILHITFLQNTNQTSALFSYPDGSIYLRHLTHPAQPPPPPKPAPDRLAMSVRDGRRWKRLRASWTMRHTEASGRCAPVSRAKWMAARKSEDGTGVRFPSHLECHKEATNEWDCRTMQSHA